MIAYKDSSAQHSGMHTYFRQCDEQPWHGVDRMWKGLKELTRKGDDHERVNFRVRGNSGKQTTRYTDKIKNNIDIK